MTTYTKVYFIDSRGVVHTSKAKLIKAELGYK